MKNNQKGPAKALFKENPKEYFRQIIDLIEEHGRAATETHPVFALEKAEGEFCYCVVGWMDTEWAKANALEVLAPSSAFRIFHPNHSYKIQNLVARLVALHDVEFHDWVRAPLKRKGTPRPNSYHAKMIEDMREALENANI